MRRMWIAVAVAGLALASSVLAGASLAGAAGPSPESTTAEAPGLFEPFAEEGCSANNICLYSKTGFEEVQFYANCATVGASGPIWKSARNRCGNKTGWLRLNGTVIACMNPSGNRPNPGDFNEVYISKEYGAFC